MTHLSRFILLCLFLFATAAAPAMHLEPGGRGRAAHPTRILLTGDSLMESMGPQMKKAMAGYENITLLPIGKRSTGLARPDFYNWPKVLEQHLRSFRPHIVIMWVGTNDPQNIYGHKGLGEPCSRPWLRAYGGKILEIARLCEKYGARIIFIGPPVMDEEPLNSQLSTISKLMYRICKYYKLGYISSRSILADSLGRYRHTARMPDGRNATIRWKDRVHITGDGNRLVMNKLLPYMGHVIPGTPATQGKKPLKRRGR